MFGLFFLSALLCLGTCTADNIRREVGACRRSFMQSMYPRVCPDLDGAERCLNNINPRTDHDRQFLNKHLDFIQDQKNKCPIMQAKGKCLEEEMQRCTSSKGYHRVQAVSCKAVKSYTNCLLKLKQNYNCTHDELVNVIESHNRTLQNCTDEIEPHNELCTVSAISKCTEPVYNDFFITKANDGSFNYRCKPDVVAEAKRCLAERATICHEPDHHLILENKITILNRSCPGN